MEREVWRRGREWVSERKGKEVRGEEEEKGRDREGRRGQREKV